MCFFTDGAAESSDPSVITYDLVSIGGVAIDTATEEIKHFGSMVPKVIVDEWKAGGIQQVITQAEVYPVLLAKELFGATWKGRRVLSFIDNDAARHALVKGKSANAASDRILHQFWEFAAEHEMMIWIERVPTKSNPADGPSRDDWSLCWANQVERVWAHLGIPISVMPILTYDTPWV